MSTTPHAQLESPYRRALGGRRSDLHPVLQRYFDTIPSWYVGVGEGVFDRFGTRHRWLAPVLILLKRRGVIVPGRHRDVPFRIENRTVAGRAVATRTVQLPAGPWTMTDAVSLHNPTCEQDATGMLDPTAVVDVLGQPETVEVSFEVIVAGGKLRLESRAVWLRIGARRVRIPRPLAPRIALTERFDDGDGRQHVDLRVDAPIIGRVYDYRGSFTYRIEENR